MITDILIILLSAQIRNSEQWIIMELPKVNQSMIIKENYISYTGIYSKRDIKIFLVDDRSKLRMKIRDAYASSFVLINLTVGIDYRKKIAHIKARGFSGVIFIGEKSNPAFFEVKSYYPNEFITIVLVEMSQAQDLAQQLHLHGILYGGIAPLSHKTKLLIKCLYVYMSFMIFCCIYELICKGLRIMIQNAFESKAFSVFHLFETVEINNEDVQNESECAICLENYVLGEMCKVLGCLHRFHQDCILKTSSINCPICRKKMISLRIEETSQFEQLEILFIVHRLKNKLKLSSRQQELVEKIRNGSPNSEDSIQA